MIEIPGYRILRPLGRGGMATVYLALQESVDREVALKIMSPALLADPTYGERFLREARIAAKLHHPHVVGIHDVGRQGDSFYIAMEYLAGGAVLEDDGRARDVSFALRIVREIARALHYANSKSFVHRDVKPDNILLREDGTSALTDFGIARANDSSTRMTRTGAVVGTPHYMSPEQARGRALDGRSDLYSLGIVLYELLVGRVPYQAEDSLAVGIMHITQPIPQLPSELKSLQPLLDLLLAKEPDDRFQDGAAVAAAIEALEKRVERGELRDLLRMRDTPPGSPVTVATASPLLRPQVDQRNRAEPSFGRMDDIAAVVSRPMHAEDRRRDHPRKAPRSSARSIFVVAVVILLGTAATLAWRNQDRLRALLPNTELNDLLARGDRALSTGKLSGASGDSAIELYRAARALDSDNETARNGLRRAGEALVTQARDATQRQDYATAHARLADARAVLSGGPAVEQAEAELKKAESQNVQIDEVFARAEAALAAGKLFDNDGAIALYEQVLATDRGNALAQSGLRKAGTALAAQARELLNQRKVDEATALIEDIARNLPSDPAIPNLRAELSRSRETADAAVEAQLKRAQDALRAGRISGPDNALAQFQSVLARDPNNAKAKAGLGQVAQALIVQLNAAIQDSNTAGAERLLRQIEPLAPNSAELAAARSRLRDLREQVEIAASRPVLDAAQRDRLARLIATAEQAAAAGQLMLPPGECAYDRYRAALALDGNNAQALAGLQALPQRARELFNGALSEQKLERARDLIETVAQLSPGDAALPTLRGRLAEAWLDEAERRVAENRAADARRALDAARALSPYNQRITPIEQRLLQLNAGNDGGT